MPTIDVTIPDHIEMMIAQLVEQGEFASREEAIEELLSSGLKAYKAGGSVDEFDVEDEGMMGHEDEYVF